MTDRLSFQILRNIQFFQSEIPDWLDAPIPLFLIDPETHEDCLMVSILSELKSGVRDGVEVVFIYLPVTVLLKADSFNESNSRRQERHHMRE